MAEKIGTGSSWDIIGTPSYREFLNVWKDILGGRLIVGRVIQLNAKKKVYVGTEVERSADEGTGNKCVFAIPEAFNYFVDEFRWDR